MSSMPESSWLHNLNAKYEGGSKKIELLPVSMPYKVFKTKKNTAIVNSAN